MSVPKPVPPQKSSPGAEKPDRQKTEKLWISAALVGVLLSASMTGARADNGQFDSLGTTPNDATANLTAISDNRMLNKEDSSASTSLDVAQAGNQDAADNRDSLARDKASSVNLQNTHQATTARVISNGAIVLQ